MSVSVGEPALATTPHAGAGIMSTGAAPALPVLVLPPLPTSGVSPGIASGAPLPTLPSPLPLFPSLLTVLLSLGVGLSTFCRLWSPVNAGGAVVCGSLPQDHSQAEASKHRHPCSERWRVDAELPRAEGALQSEPPATDGAPTAEGTTPCAKDCSLSPYGAAKSG